MRANGEPTARLSISDLIHLTPSPVREHPRAQTEWFGPFRVLEELGEGGMASVHRAEVVRGGLRKTVALKRMWPHLSDDPQFVASFVREGQLAQQLRHPNIARAFEHGKIEDTFYIAMELVPGPTLAQVMTQSRSAAGAIPLNVVIQILIQLCDALDHAHEKCDEAGHPLSIIHRDVAPSNVIVSSTGVVKLIDFGVAKARGGQTTQVGMIKGKLAYVAPEYTFGVLDRRADLFSLGVVAYELITGQRLLLGANPVETIANVRDKPIQPPSRYAERVSRDLDDIVLTAVQRDPAKRWQSAAAMRVALANVARTLPAAGTAEIRTWVQWAFAQEPRPETSIVRVLGELETNAAADVELEASIVIEDILPARKATERLLPPAPVKQRRGPSLWLVFALLATIAGAAVWTGWAQAAYAQLFG